MMCGKCKSIAGYLFLIFGVLFLLRDFGIWDVFGISAWSVLFIIIGLTIWGKSRCADCKVKSSEPSNTVMSATKK